MTLTAIAAASCSREPADNQAATDPGVQAEASNVGQEANAVTEVPANIVAPADDGAGIDGAGDVLVEKSPPNITRIPYLRSVFPGARFVVWTRDPRAVALSTQRWTPVALPLLMMHWNAAYMRAIADLDDDCLIEGYEAFCADPEATLQRIARFCGLAARTPRLPVPARFPLVRPAHRTPAWCNLSPQTTADARQQRI